MVEHLLCKHKDPSSNLSSTKKKFFLKVFCKILIRLFHFKRKISKAPFDVTGAPPSMAPA
jgi:hypothetical protein